MEAYRYLIITLGSDVERLGMEAGERMTFGEYVRARGSVLLRSALALTGGNRADAEDLVQATLIKAYRSWDRISDVAAVDTYVRRAMINTHISAWRQRRVDEYPTDEIPDQPAADPADERDLHDVMRQALDRLPRQMRAAVMLRYYDDMTEPQVAEALGVTVGTVKSTVARAVAKLREDEVLRADATSQDYEPPDYPVPRQARREQRE
jgi:RNA polymerase sigma-70 factor (sigma-E family)